MAALQRCTVTINGTKFNAACASVKFGTQTDKSGQPLMGSLSTDIRVFADFHDSQNLPFGSLQTFFNLANVVVQANVVSMQIDYWKDEGQQDAICSYKFTGWISRFETINPSGVTQTLNLDGNQNGPQYQGITPLLNHMLILDLQPSLNQKNFGSISMSN
jgi:hypothetical protein